MPMQPQSFCKRKHTHTSLALRSCQLWIGRPELVRLHQLIIALKAEGMCGLCSGPFPNSMASLVGLEMLTATASGLSYLGSVPNEEGNFLPQWLFFNACALVLAISQHKFALITLYRLACSC